MAGSMRVDRALRLDGEEEVSEEFEGGGAGESDPIHVGVYASVGACVRR